MNHINKLFGRALVISLKRRQDRRDAFTAWAREQNFEFDFFDAIDAREFEGKPGATASGIGLNNLVWQEYYGHGYTFMTGNECTLDHDTKARGAGIKRRCGMLACKLSHMEASLESSFIMEDDAVACKGLEEEASKLGTIPKFDVLFLGTGILTPEKDWQVHPENPNFHTLSNASRFHAYVVNNTQLWIKYLLNSSAFANFDTGLQRMGFYKEAIALRTTKELFRQNDIMESDVQNAGPKPEDDGPVQGTF